MRMSTMMTCLTVVATFLTTETAEAGKVTVKGVHLCCGSCISAAGKALKSVEGVSKAACDRNGKIVVFQATDDKAASAGVKALAAAGFYGTATHGDKKIAFPDAGAKKGAKVKTVTFTGVHLCCGACVTGAKKALENVANVSSIDIDRTGKKVTLNGADISVTKALAALNKAGFYGKVEKKKAK